MSEPRSELARYAFGYSDKKPGWLFWLIHLAMVAFVLWAFLGGHAQAQPHCFSIWHFKNAQRCGGNNRPPVVSIAKRATLPRDLGGAWLGVARKGWARRCSARQSKVLSRERKANVYQCRS